MDLVSSTAANMVVGAALPLALLETFEFIGPEGDTVTDKMHDQYSILE